MEPTTDMVVSPYDRSPSRSGDSPLVQLNYKPTQRWVPSRFNARAAGDDGRLILWNTYTGAISVFQPEDRDEVVAHLASKGLTAPLDKFGTYLSKRGFLVRDGLDEMAQFRYAFAQQHWRTDVLQLILLASEDCNFRCVYCYEKFKRGTMLPEVRQGVRALVQQRAPHLRSLSAEWFGGEPLYGWEAIEEISPYLKETADRYGLVHGQAMTTNGYLLTEERATKLLHWGCTSYQITIDGLPEEHDCKRVGRDGSPTYHVILDNLRSLRERKQEFTVSIRVNFDQQNLPRLGAFLEALSEDFSGDKRFKMRFRAVGKWGGDNDENLSTCGTGEQANAMNSLRQKAEEVNLHQEGGIRGASQMGAQVCYAARPYNFIVGATGKLMKCTIALDDMDANVVGQLRPDGNMELNPENMSKWVNPHFETDSLCQRCYVLPGCQGAACPLTRIRDNERTCCGVKGSLKGVLRYTLWEAAKTRGNAPEPVPAGAAS
ncbi:MAG TPA: radical SAM protein [Longimicrobiaceae bacterium]|nr:radical SAM protein [Longimicrobiaceae bacterium]